MKTGLDHLSLEEIAVIKQRYYQGESVYQLVNEYDLRVSPAMFHKLFPLEQVEKYGCSKCKVNLVTNTLPRSKKHQKPDLTRYFCPICGRRPFADNCGWIALPLLSDKEIADKRKQIKIYHGKLSAPIEYNTLPFTQKMYIAALCKALLDEDLRTIRPYCESQVVLTSTTDLRQRLYGELIKCGAITVSPDSCLDAFEINSKTFPRKYDREKVAYKLNLLIPKGAKSILDAVECPSSSSADNSLEILLLWKEIAIGECIAYLQYRLHRVGLDFNPGPKTHAVFMELLDSFSVSQIYYIIWREVNDALRWYSEGSISKQRAANSIIGACLRHGENAVSRGRELPHYSRPAACKPSILTLYFYDKVLKIGQQADFVCPSLDYH